VQLINHSFPYSNNNTYTSFFLVIKTLVSSHSSIKEGWFTVNFWSKITHLKAFFLFPFYWNKWFSHLFHFSRLSATLFVFLCSLFDSDCQISFDPVQIKSMTLESSTPVDPDPETWVFRRLKYSHMCRL